MATGEFIDYRFFEKPFESEKQIFVIGKRLYEYGNGARAVCANDVGEYLIAYNGGARRFLGIMAADRLYRFGRRLAAVADCENVERFGKDLDSFSVIVRRYRQLYSRRPHFVCPFIYSFGGERVGVGNKRVVYVEYKQRNADGKQKIGRYGEYVAEIKIG